MRRFYVYIMASRSRVIYVGVTNDLVRRVQEHKNGVNPGFTKKYRVKRLVERSNPTWHDLADRNSHLSPSFFL